MFSPQPLALVPANHIERRGLWLRQQVSPGKEDPFMSQDVFFVYSNPDSATLRVPTSPFNSSLEESELHLQQPAATHKKSLAATKEEWPLK